VKWVVVGLLLFDGCRERRRLELGLAAVLAAYLIIGLQVVRWVLPGLPVDGDALSRHAMMIISTVVGYHRNDVSVMLAGASWALISMRPMVVSARHRASILPASVVVFVAQLLTGGRGGYIAWCIIGLTLGLVRRRQYLLLAPLVVVLVVTLLPSVTERALHGLFAGSEIASRRVDVDELTSGRNLIWPLVIDRIWEAPLVGYGRAAMQRTGVSMALMDAEIEGGLMVHPHNAYLEMLLDSGVVGLLVALALYGSFLAIGFSFVRNRQSRELASVGCIGVSLVLAQLVGAFSGQSFWPREQTAGLWCVGGLLLRVWTQPSCVAASLAHPGRMERQPARSADTRIRPAIDSQLRPDPAWWRRRGESVS
jgi:O-antigen ligase